MKFITQFDSCPSPWDISAPCSGNYPSADYYGTADLLLFSSSCKTPITGSQTFPNLYPCGHFWPLKPLGCYLTPGEPNHALNHSYRMILTDISLCQAEREKPARPAFSNFHPFGCQLLLRCCIAFPIVVAIGFGYPHHYCPCPFFNRFRFSGYGFTTLCTTHTCRCASHSGVLVRILSLRFDRPLLGLLLSNIDSVWQGNFTPEFEIWVLCELFLYL